MDWLFYVYKDAVMTEMKMWMGRRGMRFQVGSGRRDAGAVRSLVIARDLQFE